MIIIRAAQEPDIDFLVETNRLVHDLHLTAVPSYFKQPEPGAVAELFRARLQRPDARVWIACVGDEPVGCAVTSIRERAENALCSAQRFCELEEIGVAPDHRRQGVARALIEHVLADARASGIGDVQLTCWSFNCEAQAAFAALGFRPMYVRFSRETDVDV